MKIKLLLISDKIAQFASFCGTILSLPDLNISLVKEVVNLSDQSTKIRTVPNDYEADTKNNKINNN